MGGKTYFYCFKGVHAFFKLTTFFYINLSYLTLNFFSLIRNNLDYIKEQLVKEDKFRRNEIKISLKKMMMMTISPQNYELNSKF